MQLRIWVSESFTILLYIINQGKQFKAVLYMFACVTPTSADGQLLNNRPGETIAFGEALQLCESPSAK